MGFLKKALFIGDGSREGAAHVAEKLALEQGLWYGGAVNGDKGPLSPLAVLVQGPGY